MIEKEHGNFAEGLFECEPVARPRGYLFTAAREVFFESLCVSGELRSKLVDLATEVPGLRLLVNRLLLVNLQIFALGLDERGGGAGPLEDGAQLCGRSGGLIGSGLRLARVPVGQLQTFAQPRHVGLLGSELAKGARLLVSKLFDLATN